MILLQVEILYRMKSIGAYQVKSFWFAIQECCLRQNRSYTQLYWDGICLWFGNRQKPWNIQPPESLLDSHSSNEPYKYRAEHGIAGRGRNAGGNSPSLSPYQQLVASSQLDINSFSHWITRSPPWPLFPCAFGGGGHTSRLVVYRSGSSLLLPSQLWRPPATEADPRLMRKSHWSTPVRGGGHF